MKTTSDPAVSARPITFANETTAEESTPVTRRRSITRNRGGVASSTRGPDPLQQAIRRPEEDEPAHAQDLDPVGERAQLGAIGRRSIDGRAIGLAEGHLAHQLDPAVADREQHDRRHEPEHHAEQEPPRDDPQQDHEHHGVFERGQRPSLVPDPLDDEGQTEEHQHAPDDHPRDQPDDLRADHDGGQRDERRDQARGPRVHPHPLRERREGKRVIAGDPPERPRHDVQDACVAELPVRVEVPVQDELGAADVEQDRDRGHEDRGHDRGPRLEHGEPVGATDRADASTSSITRPSRTVRAANPPRGPPPRRSRWRPSRSRTPRARSRSPPGSRAAASRPGPPRTASRRTRGQGASAAMRTSPTGRSAG